MSAFGKNTSMVRKKDLAQQNLPTVAVTKLIFKHQAVGGETGINLLALTAPTEDVAAGFVQPSTAKLATARLLENRNNLKINSSVRGDLNTWTTAAPTTGTQITFSQKNFGTALPGEVFTCELTPIISTGAVMVDSDPISITGTLAAGQTDFVVGQVWEGGKYVTISQFGAILVLKDGEIQYRNVGNAAAGAGVNGDYQELSTGGLANTIRFNTAENVDCDISVLSIGHTAFRPNESILAVTDNLAGQLQQVISVLAAMNGLPTSFFQQVPSSVDLTTFGNAVYAAQTSIAALITRANALELPTLQSDAIATRLGQKIYVGGATYNGVSLAVTPNNSIVSNRMIFIPYQIQDGTWRLRFNITAILTANQVNLQLTVAGVTFSTLMQSSGAYQAVAAACNGGQTYGLVDNGTNTIRAFSSSANNWTMSGDVELASKPTWAY